MLPALVVVPALPATPTLPPAPAATPPVPATDAEPPAVLPLPAVELLPLDAPAWPFGTPTLGPVVGDSEQARLRLATQQTRVQQSERALAEYHAAQAPAKGEA